MKKKVLLPGSECIYYKIYSSEYVANEVLNLIYTRMVEPKNNSIRLFFFIRYKDPDPHLRLRFFVSHTEDIHKLIRRMYNLTSQLYKSKLIWKIQIDMYEREIERYQLLGIETSELIFSHESSVLCRILGVLIDYGKVNQDWYIALWLTHLYLTLSMDKVQILKFVSLVAAAYHQEFGYDSITRSSINTIYRKNKRVVESILQNQCKEEYWPVIQPILKDHAAFCQGCFKFVKTREEALYPYIQSLIHMANNRIFTQYARMNEMMIYDLLKRYYMSLHARGLLERNLE